MGSRAKAGALAKYWKGAGARSAGPVTLIAQEEERAVFSHTARSSHFEAFCQSDFPQDGLDHKV
jgi:hypothetical protein